MAADVDPECRLAAIEAMGTLEVQDPRVVQQLADGMEHADPAVRLASYRAIQKLTGQDLGPDPKAWRQIAGEVVDPAVQTTGGSGTTR